MKLLWLCNMMPGDVKKAITGQEGNGLWVDHMLSDLRALENMTIRVLCPYDRETHGAPDSRFSYRTFTTREAHQYLPELEAAFCRELEAYQPDVIHSWGVEFAHTLAMVNAAEKTGYLPRMAVSIQGLCNYIVRHYCEGIPYRVQRSATVRDFLRRDNLARQQQKYVIRGGLERQTLCKVSHIIGRTHWDQACTAAINPRAAYHKCNETLRNAFYQGRWDYDRCRKYQVFAPSCSYPVKGFHHLLEAFALVLRDHPEAELMVAGKGYRNVPFLRRSTYQKYLLDLTEKYGLQDKVHFLGNLDAEGMKQVYLDSNVFVLPSTIENSPNTLCEAMILGVPCVAGDVGGVSTLMVHNTEGYLYQSTAPYMLAHYIGHVFDLGKQAEELGQAAQAHARQTHDPEANFRALLDIYTDIMG